MTIFDSTSKALALTTGLLAFVTTSPAWAQQSVDEAVFEALSIVELLNDELDVESRKELLLRAENVIENAISADPNHPFSKVIVDTGIPVVGMENLSLKWLRIELQEIDAVECWISRQCLIEEALNIARAQDTPRYRVWGLAEVLARFPDQSLDEEVWLEATSIQNESERRIAIGIIAKETGSVRAFDEAIANSRAILDDESRSTELASLAQAYASHGFLEVAWEVMVSIDAEHRSDVYTKQLIGEFLELNDFVRAYDTIGLLNDSGQRDQGFLKIIAAVERSSRYESAETLLPSLVGPQKDSLLSTIAVGYGSDGLVDEALRLASLIEDTSKQRSTMFSIVRIFAETLPIEDAILWVQSRDDPSLSDVIYQRLIQQLIEVSDLDNARRVASLVNDPRYIQLAYSRVATFLAYEGRFGEAIALAAEYDLTPGASIDILDSLLLSGNLEMGLAFLEAQESEYVRSRGYAMFWATTREEKYLLLAKEYAGEVEKSRQLGLLGELAVAGDFQVVNETALELGITDFNVSEALGSMVGYEANKGNLAEALSLAKSIPVLDIRNEAMLEVAIVYAENGEFEAMQSITETLGAADMLDFGWARLASVISAGDNLPAALSMARNIRDGDRVRFALFDLEAAMPYNFGLDENIVNLAASFSGSLERTMALRIVAISLAQAGRYPDAMAAVNLIELPYFRIDPILEIAGTLDQQK